MLHHAKLLDPNSKLYNSKQKTNVLATCGCLETKRVFLAFYSSHFQLSEHERNKHSQKCKTKVVDNLLMSYIGKNDTYQNHSHHMPQQSLINEQQEVHYKCLLRH